MIALVNVKGRRLYNSPAYHEVLGYTAAELARTPVFETDSPGKSSPRSGGLAFGAADGRWPKSAISNSAQKRMLGEQVAPSVSATRSV
jgi:hypothetical protein